MDTNEIDAERLIGYLTSKKCPKCGAQLLKNKENDEWCSHSDCDYGCEEFNEIFD